MADINKQLKDLLKSHFLNYSFKLRSDYVSIQIFIREGLQFFNNNIHFKNKYPDVYERLVNGSINFRHTHKENLKSLFNDKDEYIRYQDMFNKDFKKILNDNKTFSGNTSKI